MTDLVLLLTNRSIPLGGTVSNSETLDCGSMSAAWKARSGEFESRRRSCRFAVIELGSSAIVRSSFWRLHRILSYTGGPWSTSCRETTFDFKTTCASVFLTYRLIIRSQNSQVPRSLSTIRSISLRDARPKQILPSLRILLPLSLPLLRNLLIHLPIFTSILPHSRESFDKIFGARISTSL